MGIIIFVIGIGSRDFLRELIQVHFLSFEPREVELPLELGEVAARPLFCL
jgi:hypothetical protein